MPEEWANRIFYLHVHTNMQKQKAKVICTNEIPTQYHFLINFWFYKGFIIICPWKFRVWGTAEGMQYYLITPELYISVLICHICRLYSLVLSLKKKQTDFCSKFWCSLAMRHKDNSLLIYDRAEIKKTWLNRFQAV